MSDPRFYSSHLEPSRRVDYRADRARFYASRCSLTIASEWVDHLAPSFASRPPSAYVLIQSPSGVCFPLRFGLTAVGRYPENDIVIDVMEVSRRHCVLIAHAGGGCEVYD